MAGTPITAGARGEARRSPTSTEYGATRHTLAPAQPGRIPTPVTMEPRRAEPITTMRRGVPRSQDAAPIPISTPETPQAVAVARPTTRTLESSRAAELATPGTFIRDRGLPGAVASPTTPTRTPE